MERALIIISVLTLILIGYIHRVEAGNCTAEIQPGLVQLIKTGNSVSLSSDYHRVVYQGTEISKHTKMIKAEEAALNAVLFCVPEAPTEEPPEEPNTGPIDLAANLSWTIPTTREDGTPLGSDLAGYRIYAECSDFFEIVEIKEPSTTSHRWEGLPSGLCLFSITAFDIHSLESARSETKSKQIGVL